MSRYVKPIGGLELGWGNHVKVGVEAFGGLGLPGVSIAFGNKESAFKALLNHEECSELIRLITTGMGEKALGPSYNGVCG